MTLLAVTSQDGVILDSRADEVVEECPSFNLTVMGSHTFAVGVEGVLVHNEGDEPTGKVYVGRDSEGNIIYVGQTRQDLEKRESQHHQDAVDEPDKYGWKEKMTIEVYGGMDGLTDDQMDYHERRVYDELKEKHNLQNRQEPLTDPKVNALIERYCN